MNSIKNTLWRVVALSLATLAVERNLVLAAVFVTMIGLLTGMLYLSLT